MNIEQMREEIKRMASELPASKLDVCLGKSKDRVKYAVAALRFAGLEPGATEFECNYCGETFPADQASAVVRHGVPVIVCASCSLNEGLISL